MTFDLWFQGLGAGMNGAYIHGMHIQDRALVSRKPAAYGVVLNANAGGVTPRLARRIERVVGAEHVFLSRSEEHAREILQLCLERGYRTVFAGGGDGTILQAVNTLRELGGDDAPDVAVLRLGTGNALARHLGAGRPLVELDHWHNPNVDFERIKLRLIEHRNTLFPFGGMGLDGAVLNDYVALRKRWGGMGWRRLFSGLSGYFIAGFAMTIPRFLRRPMPEIEVINLGGPAWRCGTGGVPVGDPIPTGGVLYRGPASTVGVATTPRIGYGVHMFPYACRMPDRFQLRVMNFTPMQCARQIPGVWRGTLQHPDCHDFFVERINVRSNRAMPLQLGGDALGHSFDATFGLAERPVTFIGRVTS
jgi:diacylglycerol kinase family enzyme